MLNLFLVLNKKREFQNLTKEELKFSYRESSIEGVILSVDISLKKVKKEEIKQKMDAFLVHRKRTQPWDMKTVRCMFKNPTQEISAAKLIDSCGLKGIRVGGAQVSEKHANFIINVDNASSHDIMELIELIKRTVMDKHKVMLEEEVRIIK